MTISKGKLIAFIKDGTGKDPWGYEVFIAGSPELVEAIERGDFDD